MLNITHYQRNANQNHNEVPLHASQDVDVWWQQLQCCGVTGLQLVEMNGKKKQRKKNSNKSVQFSSVTQYVWLFVTPWNAACQASLSITNSQSLVKLMSIESVMPSNHLILCCPILLLPSVFASIRVFSNESVLCMRWQKYWSFSTHPSNEYLVFIFLWTIFYVPDS